jgi:hypothetical protein
MEKNNSVCNQTYDEISLRPNGKGSEQELPPSTATREEFKKYLIRKMLKKPKETMSDHENNGIGICSYTKKCDGLLEFGSSSEEDTQSSDATYPDSLLSDIVEDDYIETNFEDDNDTDNATTF